MNWLVTRDKKNGMLINQNGSHMDNNTYQNYIQMTPYQVLRSIQEIFSQNCMNDN